MISSDDVLTSVKRAVSVPASQPLLTDADILSLADEIIASRIVSLIESFDTEFFLRKDIIPIVGGQDLYDIPYRSMARGLRDLVVTDNSGNKRSLPLIGLEDLPFYINSTSVAGFLFQGDQIKLVPGVPQFPTSISLEVWWRLPPSKLMSVSTAGVVTNISYAQAGFDLVTLSSIPAYCVTGTEVDFVKKKSGSSILEFDKTIQNIAGNTLSFVEGEVPATLSIGDYVCPPGQSPVLNQIPNEAIGLIRSHVTYRILMAIGDYDAAGLINKQDIPAEEKDFKSIMSPRIDGEPIIVINRRSLVRGNKFSQRRWIGPP